jgi:serpin B
MRLPPPALILMLLLALSSQLGCASTRESPPMPPAAELSDFAWRFQRDLGEPEGNLVFSPLSISGVFAMLSAGASGETLSEIRHAFSFSGDDEAWHAAQGALLAELRRLNRAGDDGQNALSLSVVNDLWVQQDFAVGADFLSRLRRHYDSAPSPLDFRGDPDGARRTINAKIASDTADRIRELLPDGSVTRDARLVLTNALHFKGAWMHRFSERASQPGDFHTLDGSMHEVPMMRVTARFPYAESDGWQALSLPYAGGELEMLVLLPPAGRFLQAAHGLDAARVDGLLAAQAPTRIRLRFPRFSLRTAMPLVAELRRLGLRRVFTDRAELPGIAENLFVSAAMHEAVIEVDEQGTEAAAATAAVISLTSMPVEEPEPIEVAVDRPFLFVVRATASGAPLFLGRVTRP